MNLLIDSFSGSNASQEKTKVPDPLANVLIIAVPASIAGAESEQISFSTKRVKHKTSKTADLTKVTEVQTRSEPPKKQYAEEQCAKERLGNLGPHPKPTQRN